MSDFAFSQFLLGLSVRCQILIMSSKVDSIGRLNQNWMHLSSTSHDVFLVVSTVETESLGAESGHWWLLSHADKRTGLSVGLLINDSGTSLLKLTVSGGSHGVLLDLD